MSKDLRPSTVQQLYIYFRRGSVDRGSAFPNLLFFLVNANLVERENFENRPRPKIGPNFSLHARKAPPLTVARVKVFKFAVARFRKRPGPTCTPVHVHERLDPAYSVDTS